MSKKLKKKKNQKQSKEEENKLTEESVVLKQPTKKEFGIVEMKKEESHNTEGVRRTLDNFISTVAKSKIAVIIPLYGYWNNIKNNQLDLEVLKTVINRVYSRAHELAIILVAEERRLPSDIIKYIGVNSFAGNTIGASIEKGSSYSDYIKEGIEIATNEVNARFIMVVNPWVVLQENAIDEMANRLNHASPVIVSGYNVAGNVKPEEFDTLIFNLPKEEVNIHLDFFGMPRFLSDMMPIDNNIQTQFYMERDMWQTLRQKGFEAIVSQKLPIYVFDIDWNDIQNEDAEESDKLVFINKWRFSPEK
jgi:hypothetical protein